MIFGFARFSVIKFLVRMIYARRHRGVVARFRSRIEQGIVDVKERPQG